jgi:hypothetical protein
MLGMVEKPFSLIQDTREYSAPLAELLHKVGYLMGRDFSSPLLQYLSLKTAMDPRSSPTGTGNSSWARPQQRGRLVPGPERSPVLSPFLLMDEIPGMGGVGFTVPAQALDR